MPRINNIQEILRENLIKTREKIIIVSAFITKYGYEFVEEHLPDSVKEKIIIFRGRLDDFKRASSDFDFEAAIENGWEVYVNLDLHSKIYIFDDDRLIEGSSNLTKGGLVLNQESNSLKDFDDEDKVEVEKILSSSTKIDEDDLESILEIKNKFINNKGRDSIKLEKKWIEIFFDNRLREKIEIDEELIRREELFLNKRSKRLKQCLRKSSQALLIRLQEGIDIDAEYLIDLTVGPANFEDFYFNNSKYKYLPRMYKIGSSVFLENNDYELLSEFIAQLTSKEKQLLLEKMITVLDELYQQGIRVALDLEQIYYYGTRDEKKLKFMDFKKLDKEKKELEEEYKKSLANIFTQQENILEFSLGGSN
ncbi:phospholipase D family protein [Selenihalanaerobacter shriftii]|uniref:PLD-like domain-containing protein n=1 Tax=Selenihalanaerobacter shriftii TaxID=142842 RepID=A0A1T4NGL4_9FIRM|nr:phospholipase D family protein [Selenihalanaerobacter shriftii]SJZ77878.1 PLD-like domain-containing protein [Selenihalanaerobacter shriftii]